MSVNSTVARTRSDAGAVRAPPRKRVGLVEHGRVRRRIRPAELATESGNLDEPRRPRSGPQVAHLLPRATRPVHDQGRSTSQTGRTSRMSPSIIHAMKRGGCRRARAPPHVPDVPVDEALVVRLRRHERASSRARKSRSPQRSASLAELPTPRVLGRRPGIVGRPEAPCGRVIQRQSRRSLGIRGCEERREPGSFLARPERRALTRVRPTRRVRRPSAFRASATRDADRRDRCRACRTGSRARRTASPSTWSTKSGWSQPARRSASVPRTKTMSSGPSPTT